MTDEAVLDIPKVRSVSYSQYTLWATCPEQWKIRYVDGVKSESGIELVFGTAMHDTIQHWLTLLYGPNPEKAKIFDVKGYLKERLMLHVKKELFLEDRKLTTKEEVAEYYADGCNIIDHVLQHKKDFFPKNYELVGIEVPLELEASPGVRFRGFIDVVLYHKAAKTYYIYDFKTSRYGWFSQKKDHKKLDQLLLYKKYYSEVLGVSPDNINVKFIILKRKVNENSDYAVKHMVGFEPSHGSTSMKRANERFSKFLELFDENGVPKLDTIRPTPSESACKYCIAKNDPKMCAFSFYKSNKKSLV